MGKTSNNVAWGLEFGGSAVRLLRVTRSNSAYYADGLLEVPLDERWEKAENAAAAIGKMEVEKITDPLVACVPDEQVLFRTLSLPEAEDSALQKMVRGQLEVLIPTQAERFVTGYNSYADPCNPARQRVLLCAARRDTLAGILEGCNRLGREPDGIVPSILALAVMWSRLGEEPGTPLAVLDLGARCTSIALLEAGQVVQCAVLDSACDHWTERIAEKLGLGYQQAEQRKLQYAANPSGREADPAVHDCLQQALADWSGQLREVYEHCLEEIPPENRPKRCIVFGRSVHTPAVALLISGTLGLEVAEAPVPRRLSLAEGMDFSRSATAIGAALWAMESDWPAVNLATQPKAKRPIVRKLPGWPWAALLAWLLGATLALYGLDKIEANRLNDSLQKVQEKIEQRGGLDRQSGIGQYLATAGPTALEALDRISEVLPPKTLLTTWRYNHNGDVLIEGTVPNEKEFRDMYDKLCEVVEVDFRSGYPDKKKFRFEFRLTVGRLAKPSLSAPAAKDKGQPTAVRLSKPNAKEPAEPSKKPTTEPASKVSDAASSPKSSPTKTKLKQGAGS